MIEVEERPRQRRYNQEQNHNYHEKKRKNNRLAIVLVICVIIAVLVGIYFMLVPVVKLNGSKEEVVHYGEEYVEKGVKAYSKFKNIEDKVIITGEVDSSKLGEYTVTYKVPYFNKYKIYTRKVTVVDDIAPVIALEGEETIKLNYGAEYEDSGCSANDNYDGDLSGSVTTSKVDIDSNNYEIHYSVADSSGNKAERVRHITIVDEEAPKITLNGNSITNVITGKKYEEKGAIATDNKDGDVSANIKITGDIDTAKEGTYTVTYEVSDSSGNVAKEQRKVIVNNVEKAGIIYLTFDDGPSSTITPKVLDVLKEKGVHATFFILNYSDENEHLVKREMDEGHAIAIHGYSHNYADIYKSVDTAYENITKLQEKIKKTTGKEVKIVRFPGGSSNTISRNYCHGVMTEISKKILAEGYKYFDWNVDSNDAGSSRTKADVYRNVTTNLKQGRSNVVLMHDFSGNNKTLEALPEIIDYGLSNGYVFEVITDDTPMVAHSVQN